VTTEPIDIRNIAGRINEVTLRYFTSRRVSTEMGDR